MNPMDFGHRSFVRQRNEELLREVDAQRLGERLRAGAEVGEDELGEGKGALSMRRIVLVVAVVVVMVATLAFSGPAAYASHEHYLLTPGTCVGGIAEGQTAKGEGEGGYHKFHDNVHKGAPGTEAFEKENNHVFVDRDSCPAE